jgi:hypothetical protein
LFHHLDPFLVEEVENRFVKLVEKLYQTHPKYLQTYKVHNLLWKLKTWQKKKTLTTARYQALGNQLNNKYPVVSLLPGHMNPQWVPGALL